MDAALLAGIEFGSDGVHLGAFEAGDPDGPPTLGGADQGAEHELEDGPLAEGVGDDLEAPLFLDEQALEKIGGSDRAAVRDGHAQVSEPSVAAQEARHVRNFITIWRYTFAQAASVLI